MVLTHITDVVKATDMKKFGTEYYTNQKTYEDAEKDTVEFDNFVLTKEFMDNPEFSKMLNEYREEIEIENEKVREFCEEMAEKMKEIQDKYNPVFNKIRAGYKAYLKKIRKAKTDRALLLAFKK